MKFKLSLIIIIEIDINFDPEESVRWKMVVDGYLSEELPWLMGSLGCLALSGFPLLSISFSMF